MLLLLLEDGSVNPFEYAAESPKLLDDREPPRYAEDELLLARGAGLAQMCCSSCGISTGDVSSPAPGYVADVADAIGLLLLAPSRKDALSDDATDDVGDVRSDVLLDEKLLGRARVRRGWVVAARFRHSWKSLSLRRPMSAASCEPPTASRSRGRRARGR